MSASTVGESTGPGTPLHLVVALPAEARPVIDAFALRADIERPGVRLYAADGVRLIVTGLGKAASAAGVGFLAGAFPGPATWINVGIAGHGRRAVGEVLMAHAVVDRASGQSWYPPLVARPPVATTRVVTVDRPELEYGEDAAYDMEASAFIAAARRFQTAELVHALKVVSDGPGASVEAITRRAVGEWVAAAVPGLRQLAQRLAPLAAELEAPRTEPEALAELLGRWHFSVSDRRALRRELVRARALACDVPLEPTAELWRGVRRGRDAVRALRRRLDAVALRRGPVTPKPRTAEAGP